MCIEFILETSLTNFAVNLFHGDYVMTDFKALRIGKLTRGPRPRYAEAETGIVRNLSEGGEVSYC